MGYRLLEKMASFLEEFSGKGFICCALTILYSIYNIVGHSIASISDLNSIFCASVNMSPWSMVQYIGYRPPYRAIYIT